MESKTYSEADGYELVVEDKGMGPVLRVGYTMGANRGKSHSFFLHADTPVTALSARNIESLRKLSRNADEYVEVGGYAIRAAAAPIVRAAIAEIKAAKDDAAALLARNVPGLAELRRAGGDESRYAHDFNRMMEDEYNDGARPPAPVRVRYSDLAIKFPAAAGYLKAEDWEAASHFAKSAAGNRAKSRIAAGENVELVLAEMEAEWTAYATGRVD